ncbi:hypothetical protein E0500_025825 [Streptomyces sp. KM273126]|nr:hypothetical protein [Streptomyces sp. KM273126]
MSVANAMWCSLPCEPVQSSVWTTSYDLLLNVSHFAAILPVSSPICSVGRAHSGRW